MNLLYSSTLAASRSNVVSSAVGIDAKSLERIQQVVLPVQHDGVQRPPTTVPHNPRGEAAVS